MNTYEEKIKRELIELRETELNAHRIYVMLTSIISKKNHKAEIEQIAKDEERHAKLVDTLIAIFK